MRVRQIARADIGENRQIEILGFFGHAARHFERPQLRNKRPRAIEFKHERIGRARGVIQLARRQKRIGGGIDFQNQRAILPQRAQIIGAFIHLAARQQTVSDRRSAQASGNTSHVGIR